MIDEDYLLIVLCFALETVATAANEMNNRLQLQLMAGRQARQDTCRKERQC